MHRQRVNNPSNIYIEQNSEQIKITCDAAGRQPIERPQLLTGRNGIVTQLDSCSMFWLSAVEILFECHAAGLHFTRGIPEGSNQENLRISFDTTGNQNGGRHRNCCRRLRTGREGQSAWFGAESTWGECRSPRRHFKVRLTLHKELERLLRKVVVFVFIDEFLFDIHFASF